MSRISIGKIAGRKMALAPSYPFWQFCQFAEKALF